MEKLAYYVNLLGEGQVYRVHHGSLSKEQRDEVERDLREDGCDCYVPHHPWNWALTWGRGGSAGRMPPYHFQHHAAAGPGRP